jgi:hypothetical protein
MSKLKVAALGIGMGLMPAAAQAAALMQVTGFSGIGPALVDYPSFDPALGALQRIDVSITGSLIVRGLSQLNLIPTPSGPIPAPVPLTAVIQQDFSALAGRGFDFATPATYILNSLATGLGEAVTLTVPFSYDFAFTDLTDLIGFAIPGFSGPTIPPTLVAGQRSDFLDLAAPLDDLPIQMLLLTSPSSTIGLIAPTAESVGVLRVTYTYNEALPTPGVEVAEPGSLAVLGFACLGLLRARCRAQGIS